MNDLMQYIVAPDGGGMTDHAVRKYRGDVATGYDAKRENSPKWHNENRIISDMLSDVPSGSWIFDCPVGTGRFIPLYEEKGFLWRGMDVSEDMLAQSAAKVTDKKAAHLMVGDIRSTGLKDKSNNASIMCRLTRWLSPQDCQAAMRELQRITRDRIIFTARVHNHPHARPYGLFTSVLDGWAITRDEEADGPDYRVIMLEPT